MNFEIRPFADGDYPVLAELQRRTSPVDDYFPDGEVIRQEDLRRNPKVFRERWSAVWADGGQGGKVVGQAVLTQDPVFWHPTQYVMNILVEPEFQGRGIGREFSDLLRARLEMLKASTVRCPVHELSKPGLEFLGRREFVETHRMWQSTMKLQDFDSGAYAGLESKLSREGVRIMAVRELEREPGYAEHIYELERKVSLDIPSPDEQPHLSFEDFWSNMNRKRGDGSLFLVALRGDEYLGLTFGFRVRGTERFHILLTGVAREGRQLGVATALKAAGLARARESGCKMVSTWNDSRNQPMLALNQKMGFTRHPARIFLQKKLTR